MLDRTPPARNDIARTTIAVLSITSLLAASLWVLRPFIPALLWATMIVDSTWPVMLAVQARLGGRRGAAVAVMTVVLLLLLIVPLYLAVTTVLSQYDRVGELIHSLTTRRFPPPPSWLETVPLVGHRAAQRWLELAALNADQLADQVLPYVKTALSWFAAKMGGLGGAALQLLLTVLISVVLYARGETAANAVRRFLRKLSGERGEAIVNLSAQAIRAVALGIVVTAVLQTVLAAGGLFAVGLPFAGLIAAVVFILCIAQLGPLLAMVPCVVWLYVANAPGRATVLLVVTLVAQAADNVVRPLLIRRGADLSLLLIIPGVIGGLLWLGVIGLFIGPVTLAVASTLLDGWMGSSIGDKAPDPVAERPRGGEGVDERSSAVESSQDPGKIREEHPGGT
jgi:predicted PurR-regulated permease PerM